MNNIHHSSRTEITISGVTLIELIIVVAIIGIISSFAYPSYISHVIKSRRTEGMAGLLELADRMERHYADSGSYAQRNGSDMTAAYLYRAITKNGYYTLKIDPGADNNHFSARAIPTTKGQQHTDKCGSFVLDAQGWLSVSGGTLSRQACWK